MPEWLPWLIGALIGALFGGGGIVSVGYKLHQDSMQSQRERADDWRAIARTAQDLAEEYRAQNTILMGGNGSRDEVVAAQANGGKRRRRGSGPPGGGARAGQAGNTQGTQGGQGARRASR